MSSRALALLRRIAARGRLALLGDPGRAYLPKSGLNRAGALYRADEPRIGGERDQRGGGVAGSAGMTGELAAAL